MLAMEKIKADYSVKQDNYENELNMKKKELDKQKKELKSITAKYQEVKQKVCTYVCKLFIFVK